MDIIEVDDEEYSYRRLIRACSSALRDFFGKIEFILPDSFIPIVEGGNEDDMQKFIDDTYREGKSIGRHLYEKIRELYTRNIHGGNKSSKKKSIKKTFKNKRKTNKKSRKKIIKKSPKYSKKKTFIIYYLC